MRFRKFLVVFLVLPVLFGAVACNKKTDIDKVAAGLTTYTITAEYDGDKTVTASMRVSYVNTYDVDLHEVDFHLYPAAFREGARVKPVTSRETATAYPNGVDYGGIEVARVAVSGAEQEIKIAGTDADILAVEASVQPTKSVDIDIDFVLTLPNIRHRFGKFGENVNLGNFYPIACMYREGAFVTDPYYAIGDPFYSDIANYQVTVTVPEGLTVAMTGTSVSETNDGKTRVQSSAKAVRDFAAVIGRFERVSGERNGVQVDYFYTADSDPNASLQAALDSIETFSEQFGDYPYERYTVVETAFLQGGMEYPQLVMISDALGPELYRDAIIHETAHQWFYGLVGNDQVRYPWLDEALAEYATSLFYRWRPDYQIDFDDRIADAMGGLILYCDLYKKSGQSTAMKAVDAYTDTTEYTYMTYVKGSLLLDSLRRTIGDDAFGKGLKQYVADYRFKIATPDDLIACFEKASGRELKPFFDSWTSGKVLLFSER